MGDDGTYTDPRTGERLMVCGPCCGPTPPGYHDVFTDTAAALASIFTLGLFQQSDEELAEQAAYDDRQRQQAQAQRERGDQR